MPYARFMMQENGMARVSRAGDSVVNPAITAIATDANDTLTAAKVAGGAIQYTGFTAGRTLTVDTAANYNLTFPEMDIGDTVTFKVSITTAFAGTLAVATGVTLAGRAAVTANTEATCYLIKTAAAAFVLRVM